MIKRGDRVKLTVRAAAAFNNNKRPGKIDWTDRRGVVERITANKANAIVLWDGRKSADDVPIRSIELEPEGGNSPKPGTDDEPRQHTHLALACLVCRALRFGDVGVSSTMIEDIPHDEWDHLRVVIALNAEQCPDCDAYGFDHEPRIGVSRNIFCKACDQGFNVAPDPPGVFFVQRIGRRPRA